MVNTCEGKVSGMSSTFKQPADVNQLPHHLSEWVRVIQDVPLDSEGEFVLYWMHHAVRSHENPAFEKPLDLVFDAAFVHESPVRWAARNSSKPAIGDSLRRPVR